MKYLGIAGAFVAIVILLLAVVAFFRFVSNVTVSVRVQEPVQGVQCAVATANDSVSIDCWKKSD